VGVGGRRDGGVGRKDDRRGVRIGGTKDVICVSVRLWKGW